MDHGGHASFVDYDGQVFIPILNITFPFWSAFYCTIAQITYLQNQAQKHNTVWQEKMILSLLFISKCYLKMIVCLADWGRMSTKRSIQRSFEATLLGFVTWWSLVMKTTPNGHVQPVQFPRPGARPAYKYKPGRKTDAGGSRESRDKNTGPHEEYISLVRNMEQGAQTHNCDQKCVTYICKAFGHLTCNKNFIHRCTVHIAHARLSTEASATVPASLTQCQCESLHVCASLCLFPA